jgi:hypothetical protein
MFLEVSTLRPGRSGGMLKSKGLKETRLLCYHGRVCVPAYLLVALIVLGASPRSALAQSIVDFEPDPITGRFPDGSLPADELPIGDQVASLRGIHFGIDRDGDWRADGELPLLEKFGKNPPDAFKNGHDQL